MREYAIPLLLGLLFSLSSGSQVVLSTFCMAIVVLAVALFVDIKVRTGEFSDLPTWVSTPYSTAALIAVLTLCFGLRSELTVFMISMLTLVLFWLKIRFAGIRMG